MTNQKHYTTYVISVELIHSRGGKIKRTKREGAYYSSQDFESGSRVRIPSLGHFGQPSIFIPPFPPPFQLVEVFAKSFLPKMNHFRAAGNKLVVKHTP